MNKMMEQVKSLLEQPVGRTMGVSRFCSWQFFVGLAMYLAFFLVVMNDPFFGGQGSFSYQQGICSLLTGLVVAIAMNWEMMWFGKPRGGNLLLQLVMLPAFALWVARIIGSATILYAQKSVLNNLFYLLNNVTKAFANFDLQVLSWLFDLMKHPYSIALLFLIIVALSLRSKNMKFGALVLCLAIPLINSLICGGHFIYLLAETLLLLGGMALQFCRYDQVVYYENIYLRLNAGGEIDAVVARIILRIMKMASDNKSVTENNFYSIVSSEYRKVDNGQYSEMDIKRFGSEISRRMVYEYDIAKMEIGSNGMKMLPNSKLFLEQGILTGIAIFPRLAFMGVITLLWILSPIDIVPDVIPCIGVLDDVAVTVLSMVSLRSTAASIK